MVSVDVLVIGAGQAGLAAGYRLRRTDLSFLLVDSASRVGDSWRNRWDSLSLFTPARYSSLPGMALAGDPDRLPTRDEIADYLEIYARHFAIPVRLADAVSRLERVDGHFIARLASGTSFAARSVIVAAGAFQLANVPAIAGGLAAGVVQHTANTYRDPWSLPGGTVLVAGDGATGRQIALELAATHRALLATGRPRQVVPEKVLGRSIFWWLERLGLLRAPRDSRLGRLLRRRDPFPGRQLALSSLRRAGVVVKPRVAAMKGREVTFGDDSREAIDSVVWAVGYRDDTSWINVAGALEQGGRIIESEGISPVEGLYFVGRSWQRSRSSALLFGVGQDAELIVDHLVRHAGYLASRRSMAYSGGVSKRRARGNRSCAPDRPGLWNVSSSRCGRPGGPGRRPRRHAVCFLPSRVPGRLPR